LGGIVKNIVIAPVSEYFNNITILQKGITIPIIDNKFEFELKDSSIEAYFLIFKEKLTESGFQKAVTLLPDIINLEIRLFSDSQSMNNTVKGGKSIN
jgi:hypothetical protein